MLDCFASERICSCQELKKTDAEDIPPGVIGVDFMEHWCVSTQATLFCYLHWMKALKSDIAKSSAELGFDLLIGKTPESGNLSMIVSDECPLGAIPTSGLKVHDSGG